MAAIGVGLVAGPLIAPVGPASASTPTITPTFSRVSVSGSGQQADGQSTLVGLDADGSVVAFTSAATNLVAGDTNGLNDVFVRDRTAGTTERVDVSSAGEQANGEPGEYGDDRPSVSATGRWVAFTSQASNLVAGDTNGLADVFVRDRTAGTTTRVSVTSTGQQAEGQSSQAAISADGRYVTFVSDANLTGDPSPASADVYQRDLVAGTTRRVSLGQQSFATAPQASSDGRFVAYTDGFRVRRRDMTSSEVIDVATGPGGVLPDSWTYAQGISADGDTVAIESRASNLTANDPTGNDAYVVRVGAGTITRLTDAVPSNGEVSEMALSADGATLVVSQLNRPLRAWFLDAGGSADLLGTDLALFPALDDDGSVLAVATSTAASGDTNGVLDIYAATLGPATDHAPPTVSCQPADGSWQPANVTVSCTATDVGSGLASAADASFSLSTAVADGAADGAASTGTRNVCDLAGNCTLAVSTGHRVDRADPTATVSPAAQGTFVRFAPVDASFACDDVGSGIGSCTALAGGVAVADGAPLPTSSAGTWTIDVTAQDAAFRTTVVSVPFVVTDTTLSGTITGPGGAPMSGAQVRLWQAGTVAGWVTTAADGTYEVSGTSFPAGAYEIQVIRSGYADTWVGGADLASATSFDLGVRPRQVDAQLQLTPDTTPPTVTCSAPSPASVYSHEVTVSCTAADEGALADPADAAFSLTTAVGDGSESDAAMTTTRQVCDTSANCTAAGPYGPYSVDRKAPAVTISVPAEGQVYDSWQLGPPSIGCSDLHLVSCTTDLTSPYLDSTPGPHSFSVTGTDLVGHTTTVQRSYRVRSATLRGLVVSGSPLPGVTVTVWPISSNPLTDPPAGTATTGADGTWAIPNAYPNLPYYARFTKTGYDTTWIGSSTAPGQAGVSAVDDTTGANVLIFMTTTDTTPPSFSCNAPGPGGWSGEVSVPCTAGDPSGLASGSPASFVLTTSVGAGGESTAAFTASRQLCDQRGNCTTAGPYGPYKVDRRPPTVTCAVPPSSWQANNIPVPCSASDTGVGISGSPNPAAITSVAVGTETSAAIAQATVCDLLGNCTNKQVPGIKIDRKGPTLACQPADGTWHADNVSRSCSLTDGGSGLLPTWDPLPPFIVNQPTPTSINVSTSVSDGTETATATATSPYTNSWCDNVGNCSPQPTVTGNRVDRKAPAASCTAPPPVGQVLADEVSVSCQASDGGSGLAQAGDDAFVRSTAVGAGAEASGVSLASRSVCDALAHCTTLPALGPFDIDRKAPEVTIANPGPGTTVPQGTALTVDVSCSDLFLVSCASSVPDGDPLPTATPGEQQLTVTGTDAAGHVTTVVRSYSVLAADQDPPTVTCDARPPSSTTWYGTNVVVTCTAADPSGLADPAQASFQLTTTVAAGASSDSATTGAAHVCDAVGNCTDVGHFGGYAVDREAPVPSCATPPTGWSRLEVAVYCHPYDTGSGTSSGTFAVATSVGAGGWSASASTSARLLCDRVGNCTAVQFDGIKVDRVPPTVVCGAGPTGWSATAISIPCTAADVGSGRVGPASVQAVTNVPTNQESASAVATVKVCDVAGNCTTASVDGLRVDRRKPTVVCDQADGLWHASNVTLGCTQEDGGSGMASTSPAGGQPSFTVSTVVGAGSETRTATASGGRSCDQVGNCVTVAVYNNKIDRRAPSATCEARDALWHADNVSPICTPVDQGVGLADPSPFPSPTTVADGSETSSAQPQQVPLCDLLGNCRTVGAAGPYKIDRRRPQVTVSGVYDGFTMVPGATVTVTYACTDRGSGVASCAGSIPSGGTFTAPQEVGPVSMTVTASDVAGNIATSTVTWQVVAPISGRVVDAVTHEPLAGVTVWRFPASGDGPALDAVMSDGDGRYRFTSVEPGGYRFAFTRPGEYLTRWYMGSSLASARVVTVDGQHVVTLTDQGLVPASVLSGRITDSLGSPVAGARVQLYRSTAGSAPVVAEAVTAADGTWRIDGLLATTYRIGIVADGYAPAWYLDAPSKAASTAVTVAVGEQRSGLDDDLDPSP